MTGERGRDAQQGSDATTAEDEQRAAAGDGALSHGASDLELLGLERLDRDRWAFRLSPPFARFDGKLYGGTALAVSIAAAEGTTGRRALWSTVQFVASAAVGDAIEVLTEVVAEGRRAAQVRVTATVAGRLVFTALGANARPRPDGLRGTFEEMPAVAPPEVSEPFRMPFADVVRRSGRAIERNLELRLAPRPAGAASGRLALWARIPGRVATPAVLGYLADFGPMGIAQAAGRAGGGTSLDNTLRIGPPAATDWVLLDLDPQLAVDGYGHASVHLWGPDGTLLGTGSQTASMLLFD